MEKPLNSSPKRLNKHFKNRKKKQQKKQPPPLKVVYITNPIKFKATTSEFRALVQELTGQGAVYQPEFSEFPVSGGDTAPGPEAVALTAAESDYAHAMIDDEGEAISKLGLESGLDPPEMGSGTDNGFYKGQMVENLQDMSLIHDVLKSFDGI